MSRSGRVASAASVGDGSRTLREGERDAHAIRIRKEDGGRLRSGEGCRWGPGQVAVGSNE